MDGSVSDGSSTPSMGLSSPHSMQPSPNPDSSGVIGEPPPSNHPVSTPGTPPILTSCPPTVVNNLNRNGALSPCPKSAPPSLSPTSTGAGCLSSVVGPGGPHPHAPRSVSPGGPISLTGKGSSASPYSLPAGVSPVSVGGLVMPRHDALQVASMALNAAAAAASRGNGVGYGSHHHHHHHHHRMHAASPPGISGDGVGNECRLIDYRGAKVAAFLVGGEYLLCLPQAFELFLKHLVGGLHTVYTKLKRLDITPIVCNVEQVRILRGLGAIQPGVNRCKLLSCKDFDSLYKDCTTARRLPFGKTDFGPSSARSDTEAYNGEAMPVPGRPPKRASMVGLTSSSITHAGLLKKGRIDGEYGGYENGHISKSRYFYSTGERLEKHGLLPNGYSHHAAAQAAAAAAAAAATSPHINPLPFMALNHPNAHGGNPPGSILPAGMTLPLSSSSSSSSSSAAAQAAAAAAAAAVAANSRQHASQGGSNNINPSSRTDGSVIKDRSQGHTDGVNSSREELADVKDKFYGFDSHRLKDPTFLNGYFWLLAGASANGHSPVLNLSQNSTRGVGGPGNGLTAGNGNATGDHSGSEHNYNECADDEDNDTEDEEEDERDQGDLSDNPDVTSTANNECRLGGSHPGMPFPANPGDLSAAAALQGVSSIETLLRNIQGLLKVAADNARQQERQVNLEKAELKMEILRERECRESVEKQLLEEQRVRVLYQKRVKREKRCRRRLHEQLESEMKKRSQYEDALRSTSGETLRLLNESLQQEIERERNSRSEAATEHKNMQAEKECPMSV